MILLDTHVVVWMASGDSRLSNKAHTAIHEARKSSRGLVISDITLFEISLLFRKKRFELTVDAEAFLADIERRFVVRPITANIALQAFQLPASYPKDPVDRIIGATALVEDLPLVSADQAIRKSRAIPIIW